jgi:hypothetical protein
MPPSYGSGSGLSIEGDRLVDSHDLAHPGEKPADIRDPERRTQRPEK